MVDVDARMAFLLLFLSSFFLKPALSAIVFEDEAPFLCEGNIPYNKAPIKVSFYSDLLN